MTKATENAPIAPVDLAAERAQVGPALGEAVERVLASGHYVLGPEVEKFERDFAALHDTAHGVGVASGTDALILALRALGVEPGDKVLTSPYTFFASAGAIAWVGARPVFADIEPETGLLSAPLAAAAMDDDIKCILPVHLYGQLADIRALRSLADESGAQLCEDAAQAHGARRDGQLAGSLGDAACFSFYPTKNLGCAGEGGAVLTRHDDVHAALLRLRDHGSTAKYIHGEIGTNSRLQAVQGAILNTKLPYLEGWNARRRELAARYDAAFASSENVHPLTALPGSEPVYHQYAVRVTGADRDAVQAALVAKKIFAAVHYPRPVHLQEAGAAWGYGPGSLPEAEALAREVLCLPVHPFLSDGDADRVIEELLALAQA